MEVALAALIIVIEVVSTVGTPAGSNIYFISEFLSVSNNTSSQLGMSATHFVHTGMSASKLSIPHQSYEFVLYRERRTHLYCTYERF